MSNTIRLTVALALLLSACTAAGLATTTSEARPSATTTVSTNTTEHATSLVTTTITPTSTSTTTSSTTRPSNGLCVETGNTMQVDASCFDRDWPFSVDEGTLVCNADAVTFEAEGVVYALNGLALTRELGLEPDAIWLENPEVEGFKISIGPLIDLGLTLCV